MYRTKKDVDKHVENLLSKLSAKEFKSRAYSVARLYFDVGDYSSCQKYVEQYLAQKDNNAAAQKLLAQALHRLGHKEKALEHYKTSLDIDTTQSSTILDICELLADDEIVVDPGRAKYWCEKAEAAFPRHPITFRLRERLVAMANPDPEALINLLKSELAVRPKDALLHARLLRHYLETNQIKEAFDHSCNIEFGKNNFLNSYTWYDILTDILKHNLHDTNNWLYQLLLLTVKERLCTLSLSEAPRGTSKSLIESTELLHAYDQAIESVGRVGPPTGFGEFHTSLLQHHRGQFALHAATHLLKKAKKDQLSWRDATKFAAPLMMLAWQSVPLDSKVNWLTHAPDKQQVAVQRWYTEGTYRCSQAGHYLLSNIQDKTQSFLDKISQCCSGAHWRDKLYEKLFTSRDHLMKIKTSHFVSNAFYCAPVLRLPRKSEVEAYDSDAQREYGSSLHHFIWTLLNYKNYAHFNCLLFDMLVPTTTNCGPETLNKLDIHAFLYCAALTSQKQTSDNTYVSADKPNVLPANITDLLCPLPQMKWWDCAYKFCQNELGTELTDIRATLTRGIGVVRCIDNHGLDPQLLCLLGRIFDEKAKLTNAIDEKTLLEKRACLYYSSALPMLEKLKAKILVKIPEKRLFDYTHKDLSSKDLNALIEESKLFVAVSLFHDGEYVKAIELLSNLKSPLAFYYLSQAHKKIAEDDSSRDTSTSENKSKYSLYTIAKHFAYKALDILKDGENKDHPLYIEIQSLIEDVETNLNKIDSELSGNGNNDMDGKYSSDENVSNYREPGRNNYHNLRNLSSTPKHPSHANTTAYRTAVDSQVFENAQRDNQVLERMENQIKTFQKRLTDDFMEQTKTWFEENQRLGNKIMSTLQSDMQSTNDQFKLLKISVDQVKDQIDECRNECKDVGDLKKQIAELKKEVNKLKKVSTEQTIDESDLYNLDEEYRASESTSTFSAQLPFPAAQVMPQFNAQRLVPPFPMPPNPYQLYSQNLYNLYNQYSQFAQNPAVQGAPPFFDPARAAVNYPGVYPTPDQMYLDVAHLVPPTVPPVPTVPTMSAAPPTVPTLPSGPNIASTAVSTNASSMSKTATVDTKDNVRSLPVNVVITSSDPLPTCTTAPAPVLSVTIPPKHIKGIPHNYQIAMPSTNDTKIISPPVFSFATTGSKQSVAMPANTLVNWPQSTAYNTTNPMKLADSSVKPSLLFSSAKSSDTTDNPHTEAGTPNTSLNKSRTLSERSNTSIDNYDPCPDFKPIIPLPAEVKVTTGEEDETAIFSARAKLYRFVDKQWKERGIGEMKLLKHKVTEKVRVLMRREQIHKICANHVITSDVKIKPMKNESKAYFWVANDFADETVVLEKFCVRFKTADIAKQFYETFEKARLDCEGSGNLQKSAIEAKEATEIPKEVATPVKSIFGVPVQQTKTEFGGFTFTSTPTLKTTPDVTKTATKTSEPETTKINVFSGLTFKTTTASPFSNIFSTSAGANIAGDNIKKSADVITKITADSIPKEEQSKLNTSDAVEEFEPTAEFKPVVPLPALIDQKTGEEDETILFEHRAKLLRFDASGKEWKERGLGNVKLLVNKANCQKLRLLMRREQIMKVCCNHAVTKDMTFQKMPNMNKAVTWCAKDFSDGELVAETFCLRFKTVQVCDDFINAIVHAQSAIKDESKCVKEEQNATQQVVQSGFGDKFKLKPGAWTCDSCYTNNLDSFAKCACCEQAKPTPTNVTNSGTTAANWGDKFKPKAGSWECTSCLVRNEATVEFCSACNNSRDPSKTKPGSISGVSDDTPKFSFGVPAAIDKKPESKLSSANILGHGVGIGWGDKFKPKEGSWECKECFVRNDSNTSVCSACTSPKDPNAVKTENQSIFGSVTSGPKFNFGIPAETLAPTIESTPTQKFNFGIPPNAGNSVFGVSKTPATDEVIKEEQDNKLVTPLKPALLPTPQTGSTTPFTNKEGSTFDFVFKPKTPPKGKGSIKSPKNQKGEESDDNEYASDDEGDHIHFSPIVPLPDKVEVVTGEENETELYGHRAKLYRFTAVEWKERGVGTVKILQHKETNKLRVVMRREQVLKICLNHALTPDIIYTPKDDKTWLFAANDFSEGELSLSNFCLRFKTKEIAMEFKEAIDKARNSNATNIKNENKDKDYDEVVFINEIQATAEEKQKAKELMLPENFYTYKNKKPCQGCRGCQDDNDETTDTPVLCKPPRSDQSVLKAGPLATESSVCTPNKTSTQAFQSPMTSFYGTPMNFDKNTDTSIFRTPLGSITSNLTTTSFSPNSSSSENEQTNKENASSLFKNAFAGFGGGASLTPSTKEGNVVNPSATTKTSILAAPKLNSQNISASEEPTAVAKSNIFGVPPVKSLFGEIKNTNQQTESKSTFGSLNKPAFGITNTTTGNDNSKSENKSIFGSASNFGDSKPMFGSMSSGLSSNKSIFGGPVNNKTDDSSKSEAKSLFGTDEKPVNMFATAVQGSVFGPGALSNNNQNPSTGLFGSSGASIFGNDSKMNEKVEPPVTWSFGIQGGPKIPPASVVNDKIPEETSQIEESVDKKDTLFKVDNSLSFAALSTGETEFSIQKKADFQWEGAGQQLFGGAQKSNKEGDKSKNESGAGEEGETAAVEDEYDPHYEPIVPLPDKIVVTTGEEDEEKLFGERCKLYRYNESTREWKERGVGEMKILYHPERKTYRFLLRREQVHKAVLNTLLFADLELLPMKNSDRAWTWAARNFAENPQGEQETLAVRFKSVDLATTFRGKVEECVRKLQAAAAQAVKEEKQSTEAIGMAPLRLPKHLQDSARADPTISTKTSEQAQTVAQSFAPERTVKPNGGVDASTAGGQFKQVQFQEPEEGGDDEEEDEDYDNDDYQNEDYEAYYNDEEEEGAAFYACDGAVVVAQGSARTIAEHARLQVLFDQEVYSPKILVTDNDTGEILADMLIYTDTDFHMDGDSCTWSGLDYTSNNPVQKTVTVNFFDAETAMQFYDSCETSKASTYSSTDPES